MFCGRNHVWRQMQLLGLHKLPKEINGDGCGRGGRSNNRGAAGLDGDA